MHDQQGMKSVGTDESGFSTAIGEWICKKIAEAFKYIIISFLCGVGGAIGFFTVYMAFLQFGGLQWLFNIVKSVATM